MKTRFRMVKVDDIQKVCRDSKVIPLPNTAGRAPRFSDRPGQTTVLYGHLFLFLAAVGFGVTPWIAGCPSASIAVAAQVDPPEVPREYYQSFKGEPENSKDLEFIGPNANDCVRFEPGGLRISLPGNHPKDKPTGLATGLTVKGNFEITVHFDLLHEPEALDAGDFGTRLALIAGFDANGENAVKFTRAVRKEDGRQYILFSSQWNQFSKKLDKRNKSFPTSAKKCLLRLVRRGDLLSFWVSEDANAAFTLLREYQFSDADLKNVRIVASTGSPEASLDVRVTDLRIRMNLERVDVVANPPANLSPLPGSRGHLSVILLLGLIITVSVALAVRLLMRRRAGGPKV